MFYITMINLVNESNIKKKRHKERDSFNDSRSVSLLGTEISMKSIKNMSNTFDEAEIK